MQNSYNWITQRVSLNVISGLYTIVMDQYCFIICNKYTRQMQDVNNKGN